MCRSVGLCLACSAVQQAELQHAVLSVQQAGMQCCSMQCCAAGRAEHVIHLEL